MLDKNLQMVVLFVPELNDFMKVKTLKVFYPIALKGCQGVVFTHNVRMGGWAGRQVGGWLAGKSLSRLYLRNHKV